MVEGGECTIVVSFVNCVTRGVGFGDGIVCVSRSLVGNCNLIGPGHESCCGTVTCLRSRGVVGEAGVEGVCIIGPVCVFENSVGGLVGVVDRTGLVGAFSSGSELVISGFILFGGSASGNVMVIGGSLCTARIVSVNRS